VSVLAHTAVLLALAVELFDGVPLDRMSDAEGAVRKAAAEIPAEVSTRLDSADKLSAEDRETIIAIARQAIEAFSPDPDSKSEPDQETQAQPGTRSEPQPESEEKS
jgi:F-type H+-transporting ATPase subunit alpha